MNHFFYWVSLLKQFFFSIKSRPIITGQTGEQLEITEGTSGNASSFWHIHTQLCMIKNE